MRLTYSAMWIAAIRDCGPICKLDRDAGIDEDAVQNLLDRFRRRLEPKAMGAIGAGEYQRQAVGAVFQIVQRLRVGGSRVRMIDPLHDLPGRGRGAAGDRCGIPRARIDRFDPQSIIGLADQLLERRALQHAVDQLAPVVVGCRREIRRQPQVVSCRCHLRKVAPGRRYLICWPEIATWRPPSQTVVFGPFWSVQVRQPLDSGGRQLRQRRRNAASRQ